MSNTTLEGQEVTQQDYSVVYALEDPPAIFAKSIFLAGPTPRRTDVVSWRPEALRILQEAGYDGVVYVPENRSGKWHGNYDHQIEWEERCLNMADVILFWVPRDMVTLPALTTNDEWGTWKDSGKVVFGAPEGAFSVRYQQTYADKLKVPCADSLEETLNLALEMVRDGAARVGGQREVPLHIWRTPSFQQWHAMLQRAGNRLDGARQVWTFRVGPQRKFVFFWALHVDVYVAGEDRHKTNEVVLARPDISTIVMYNRAVQLNDSTVVLVREFRSPVANEDGYVYEVAGGSSFKPGGNPLQLAADEAHEETGLALDASRFQRHESRQMVATLSAHKAHLFSVEITDEELEQLRGQADVAYGVLEDTERTYVEVTTLGEIRRSHNVDWSMLGMILQVLA
jgi:8-oxo-dGTP pyrophosphatase MutT (NUDIX family)